MRNPGGYGIAVARADGDKPLALWFDGSRRDVVHSKGDVLELDTFTCFHCNKVTWVRPKMDAADLGGLCKVCMKLICKCCVGKGCDPLEEKLRRNEDRDRFRRSLNF